MRSRDGAGPDDSGYFLNFNRNKRSVALNLRTDDGQRVLRDLAAQCDVVVENYSPGTLAKWGMDYASLRELNPRIVLVSMAGVGQTGPWRDAVTFADTLAAMSGLSSETGQPGRAPEGLVFGLGDMVAANAAVVATLDLLMRQQGGHVDLSQLEAMAATMGPAVAEASLGSHPRDWPTPDHPNRTHGAVPHGMYPAAGEDRWIAVSVRDERQWRALCHLVELPGDGDLTTRREHEDAIDAALAAWTSRQNAAELARALQANGIPAAPVANGKDLVEADEHLAARKFYPVIDHPIAGPVRHEGIVACLAAAPGALTTPAPLLGQHTATVLAELLDMGDDERTALEAAGAIE